MKKLRDFNSLDVLYGKLEEEKRLSSAPKTLVIDYLDLAISFKEELKIEFEERAAIFEYEGGFAREEAEARALSIILKEFISGRYPEILAEFESIVYGKSVTLTQEDSVKDAKV